MNIEEKVFRKATLLSERLLPFGFKDENGAYVYQETMMGGSFLAHIEIRDGNVSGKVIDTELGEEYIGLRVESFSGGYVGEVREAYKDILRRIKDACFSETTFLSPQANRIAALIAEHFGDEPDHPFSDMENYGVFRVKETRKWYGLIMNVALAKVSHNPEDEGNVDVLNLKVDPSVYDELMQVNGIYPGYHMNHRNWISVALDERAEDDFILELLATSRAFAEKGKKK